MGFFDSIGNFFKKAASGVKDAVTSVGHFISQKAGSFFSGAKDLAKTGIVTIGDVVKKGLDTIPKVIDSGSKAINSGITVVGDTIQKVNPFSGFSGTLLIGGGLLLAYMAFNSNTANSLAQRVPLVIP